MILPRYALFAALLAAAGLPIYIHVPKFYVDEYGVGLAEIGIAFMVLRLIDVVQDPLLGRLTGRLQTRRAHAALIAAVGLVCGMVGLFAVPPPFAPLVWMSACLVVLFTSFSFLTILFYARAIPLARTLGPTGHVRLAGWRETGALLGVSLACVLPFALESIGLPPLAGFVVGFVFLAIVAAALMHPLWQGQLEISTSGFSGLLVDPEIRRFLIVGFLNAAPVAVTSALFLFFVEYRLEKPDMAGPYLLTFFVAAAATAPFWSRAAQKFGSLMVLNAGMVLSIFAFGWAFSLGSGDGTIFVLICIASGAALGADMTLLPALFSKRVAEIDGNGGEAFGLWNFCSKMTLALAAATTLPLLESAGFRVATNNTETALLRLSTLYALLPCALKVLALFVLNIGPKGNLVKC